MTASKITVASVRLPSAVMLVTFAKGNQLFAISDAHLAGCPERATRTGTKQNRAIQNRLFYLFHQHLEQAPYPDCLAFFRDMGIQLRLK